MTVAPDFETDSLMSVVYVVEGNGTFATSIVGSNAPGDDRDPTVTGDRQLVTSDFDISTDYKQDLRAQGRYLNYRITHTADTVDADAGFALTNMQFEVDRGGRR
jgi:hypothetical protein